MQFDINIFWQALFSTNYLYGALISIAVAAIAQFVATIIGFGLALMRRSRARALRGISWVYVWFFRSIPTILVLLIVWNAVPQFIPVLKNPWFTPFMAACVALAAQEAAYMAEILRSALGALDKGQQLAARALAMTPLQVMRKITIPQVARIAIPPTGNEFINMIKYTSLATVIALQELLTRAQVEVSITFRYAENYAAAAIYYLTIVSLLSYLQARIEKRYQWSSMVKPPRKAVFAGIARGRQAT